MKKKEKKRKKKRKTGIYVFLILLLTVGIGALIVLNVFTVERVEVEGNELYSDRQIEEMVLNDEYSWNSLYVYLKYRFWDVGDVPFVDTMDISLKGPHMLQISVYEKGMLGYLYIDTIGQNAYFDKDGFVVETSSEIIEGIPKVTGVEYSEVVLYERLPLEDDMVLRNLLSLTQTLKKYNLLPDQIHYDSGLEPTLTYDGIMVLMGPEENLSQKVIRLSYILPQLNGLSGTLHLENWAEDNTDIIFDKIE